MSTKLIQTKDYLLLIDEEAEIKEDDIVYRDTEIVFKITNELLSYYKEVIPNTVHKIYRCIAYYPLTEETKELDLPLLPNPFECVDIKKLAHKHYKKYQASHNRYSPYELIQRNSGYIVGFEDGYKAAQSDKQFSLEDLKKAIKMAKGLDIKSGVWFKCDTFSEEEIIQSLSTQKLPVSFEPEYRYYYHSSKEFYSDAGFVECSKEQYESIKAEIPTCPLKAEIKTITNSESRQELIGTYKY